ncbi:Gfo/Idh/MocA family oxidoreductase [Streptomyces lonarensis]|uniref:Gfo/Idh/MocA family oxidoreductase n=1 Tax=Streptomyces lonarensis TaxID=700599 RepID=A0A7X6CZZ1_9ACTN|nr:Gfo/Idh/MocA family oxidoreductase [Streptomyces lonarensis]NJQ05528.1 Gfo/Idh/MocA family oxidoreductase [Streptomyces lonarensis]
MSASRSTLRTVVAGTNFGRFYVDAVSAHPDLELAGILATGSPQSHALARRHGVPCWTALDQLPDDLGLACVVVPSAVMGGQGTELAQALLRRGVHVLQEHPVHPDELADTLRVARRGRVQYRVNTHYPHVEPVRAFLDAARRLRAEQRVLHVDAASPVHVLAPLFDILGRALGGLRPWRLAESAPGEGPVDAGGGTPVRGLQGTIAGVPTTLRVQNQIHPGDRDNHALFWHRVALTTEGGVLTLADTHGPVLWHPRMHSPRDEGHRLVFRSGPNAPWLRLPTSSVIAGAPDGHSFDEVFSELWPAAVTRALDGILEAIRSDSDVLRESRHDLAVFGAWRDLMATLGPPELIRPPDPRVLSAAELLGPPTDEPPCDGTAATTPAVRRDAGAAAPAADASAPGAGYTRPAEFFDLGAQDHTGRTGPAVLACLRGLDPAAGPLLDIGAGSGLVTRQVALAHPECEIIAAEPSAGMRAVLAGRMAEDPRTAERVTVVPEAAADLVLPDRISAAVACGVLGHLPPDQRRSLLRNLAAALAPEAPLVVELMGLYTPVVMPPTRLRRARLGRQRYEWWMAGEPAGEELMRLHTTWRVFDGERQVREVRDSYLWHTVTLEQVAEEAGLRLAAPPDGHRAAVPHLGVLRGAERAVLTR